MDPAAAAADRGPLQGESPLELASSNSAQDGAEELRPPRACEYCRAHKVRCNVDPRDPSGPCGRCVKGGRECIFTSSSRKRRKTADTRIAELEQKVDRLTARLDARFGPDDDPGTASTLAGNDGGEAPRKRQRADSTAHSTAHSSATLENLETRPTCPPYNPSTSQLPPPQPPPENQETSTDRDVIERDIITLDVARQSFHRFTHEIAPLLPITSLYDASTTLEKLRANKPTLFLAIVVASCGKYVEPKVRHALHRELLWSYADQVIMRGRKSLELIQALTVSVIWPYPVEHMGEFKLNQFIHMAVAMARDVGITKPQKKFARRLWEANRPAWFPFPNGFPTTLIPETGQVKITSFDKIDPTERKRWIKNHGIVPEPSTPETRRTLLGCYFMCWNITMMLRRPNLLPFTPYMSECMTILDTSPSTTDRTFIQWIKLARIVEDFSNTFSATNPSPNLSIWEPRGQAALETFLARVTQTSVEGISSPAIVVYTKIIRMFMHEIALYFDLGAGEFTTPFIENYVLCVPAPSTGTPTPFIAETIRGLVRATKDALDSFIGLQPQTLRAFPMFLFANAGYAVALLLRLLFISTTQSVVGRVLVGEDLNASTYVGKIVDVLQAITADNQRQPAERLRVAMIELKRWFESHRGREQELLERVQQYQQQAARSEQHQQAEEAGLSGSGAGSGAASGVGPGGGSGAQSWRHGAAAASASYSSDGRMSVPPPTPSTPYSTASDDRRSGDAAGMYLPPPPTMGLPVDSGGSGGGGISTPSMSMPQQQQQQPQGMEWDGMVGLQQPMFIEDFPLTELMDGIPDFFFPSWN